MGIAVIVLVATCIYFRSRTKESYQTGRDSTSQISKIIYDNLWVGRLSPVMSTLRLE